MMRTSVNVSNLGFYMGVKEELQQLNEKLDKARRKFAAAKERRDYSAAAKFTRDIETAEAKLVSLTARKTQENQSKTEKITSLAFHRVLTKAEQADMGKLKKSVRGLVVVHPMTGIGKEIGVTAVTGYAPKEF